MKKLFLDTETTGLSRYNNRICSLTVVDEYDNAQTFMFNPCQPVQPGASAVNGYTWEKLKRFPTFAQQANQIKNILDSADVLIAHNAAFDIGFLQCEFDRCGVFWHPKKVECTMLKAKQSVSAHRYTLDHLTTVLGLRNLRGQFHGSCEDAKMCKALYYRLDTFNQPGHTHQTATPFVHSPCYSRPTYQPAQSQHLTPSYNSDISFWAMFWWVPFIGFFLLLSAL